MNSRLSQWVSASLLISSTLLAGVVAAPPQPGPARNQDAVTAGEAWKLAVVFQCAPGQLDYIGTVMDPMISRRLADLDSPMSKRSGEHGDYQVWLIANGRTLGVEYSSEGGWIRAIASGGTHRGVVGDDGDIDRIVRNARLPTIAAKPPLEAGRGLRAVGASWILPPSTLVDLCEASTIIARGRVVGILRTAHSPVGSNVPKQHTVYAFAVERYLKGGRAHPHPVVKVWQSGGDLPWQHPRTRERGVGYSVPEDPLLTIGARYCLFLTQPEDVLPAARRQGYIAGATAGVHGKFAELDEYKATDHWRGKILLHNGFTRAPATLGNLEDHWRFRRGPEILDVTEAVAIAAIEAAVQHP